MNSMQTTDKKACLPIKAQCMLKQRHNKPVQYLAALSNDIWFMFTHTYVYTRNGRNHLANHNAQFCLKISK